MREGLKVGGGLFNEGVGRSRRKVRGWGVKIEGV